MKRHKKTILYSFILFFLCGCIIVKPVRAALSGTLMIFRVKNIKSINITLEDLKTMSDALKYRKSDINLDKIGRVKIDAGDVMDISEADVKGIKDMKVLLPFVTSARILKISAVKPSTMSFTLDIVNVNQILKYLGAKEGLPSSLNGKTFSITIPLLVNIKSSLNSNDYTIVETKPPILSAPRDVDIDQIYSSLINLPIIPEDLKSQLQASKDWKNTIYMPVIEPLTEEIDINGQTGYLYKAANEDGVSGLTVIWQSSGTFYCIKSSSANKAELINFAKSMH